MLKNTLFGFTAFVGMLFSACNMQYATAASFETRSSEVVFRRQAGTCSVNGVTPVSDNNVDVDKSGGKDAPCTTIASTIGSSTYSAVVALKFCTSPDGQCSSLINNELYSNMQTSASACYNTTSGSTCNINVQASGWTTNFTYVSVGCIKNVAVNAPSGSTYTGSVLSYFMKGGNGYCGSPSGYISSQTGCTPTNSNGVPAGISHGVVCIGISSKVVQKTCASVPCGSNQLNNNQNCGGASQPSCDATNCCSGGSSSPTCSTWASAPNNCSLGYVYDITKDGQTCVGDCSSFCCKAGIIYVKFNY